MENQKPEEVRPMSLDQTEPGRVVREELEEASRAALRESLDSTKVVGKSTEQFPDYAYCHILEG